MQVPARRNLILDYLRQQGAASQRELVEALADQLITVTQTTVSRDLAAIGAVKTRDGYALPDSLPRNGATHDSHERVIQNQVHSAAPADSLVVLKTSPGHAAIVGDAIDNDPPRGVVGTIAGENTVFVATTSKTRAAKLAEYFKGVITGNR